MAHASEPPLADAVARPATTPGYLPAVPEDRLGAEVREGVRTLDGLGAAAPREAAALDELSRLNQLARQRQAERESLFASLADDVPSLEAALLETRRELAEAQLQRSGEAALAQQLQQRLAVRDAQAHEQAAELRRLQVSSCTLCTSSPPLHRLHLCTASAPPASAPSPSPPPASPAAGRAAGGAGAAAGGRGQQRLAAGGELGHGTQGAQARGAAGTGAFTGTRTRTPTLTLALSSRSSWHRRRRSRTSTLGPTLSPTPTLSPSLDQSRQRISTRSWPPRPSRPPTARRAPRHWPRVSSRRRAARWRSSARCGSRAQQRPRYTHSTPPPSRYTTTPQLRVTPTTHYP